ncbi:hypothetical protein V8C34DRAFT_283309 [Trichoderma compactum]
MMGQRGLVQLSATSTGQYLTCLIIWCFLCLGVARLPTCMYPSGCSGAATNNGCKALFSSGNLAKAATIQFQRLHRINVVPGSTLRYDRAVQHLLVPYGGAAVYPLPTRLQQSLQNQRYQGPRHCPAIDFFSFSFRFF